MDISKRKKPKFLLHEKRKNERKEISDQYAMFQQHLLAWSQNNQVSCL
jgi:hypothetical protein